MTLQRYYRPELDVLRLCAFLFVFFVHRMDLAPVDSNEHYWGYHISLVGNYGVPLFFFLSAFLITELLTREQDGFGKISVKSFYIRRILRIWPLYLTFFFLIVLLTSTTHYFGNSIPQNAQLAFTLFSGNWYITFNQWQSYCINPLWSISVEEQLYILLPLVLFFTGKKGLKIFSFFAIAISYITIIYYAQRPTEGFSGQWTNSFVQFQFFAAGILVSLYLKGRQPNWSFVTRILLFAIGYTCWLLASMLCEVNADSPHLATISQATSGWFLILMGVMSFFFSLFGSSAKCMPSALAYLGRISYGMYVVHITIYWIVYKIFKNELSTFSDEIGLYEWKNEIGLVIAFLITVAIAMISYNTFEKRFLKLKTRYTFIPSRD
ncbi:acyltransferase family protein [Mucilaginibacter sp. SP1R1]|uniref:acyltransferase family protein n=1 Tax=Mucilaginibacter sp. SP1R1 TaxID=2723091 RepID=UPI00161FB20B|nr:acyltransferase [Mucilaginibacter sp. SP1R1]MBB6148498.1 peptidoglycan/LPS O-acetylase OafA/YrhL [Mucilaginibacter sp. SP1R1]